jgi:hypothetical protein
VERFKDDLVVGYLKPLDAARKVADSVESYKGWFGYYGSKVDQYDIKPENSYNMDEKGFLMGILQDQLRIFAKSSNVTANVVQDSSREWITVLACICADSSALSPTLIYQAVSGDLQDTWLQDFDPTAHSCFFRSSPNGWTSNDIGLQWLKTVFNRETKAKARRD